MTDKSGQVLARNLIAPLEILANVQYLLVSNVSQDENGASLKEEADKALKIMVRLMNAELNR